MKYGFRVTGWALVAACALLAAQPTPATIALEPLSVEQLGSLSDLAVHGTVESIESFEEDGRIFTRIEVVPAEFLKGLGASRVTLRLYGGTFGDRRTRVVGGPCLSVGEEVVLFLTENGPSTFDVVNLAEGKFRVVRAPGREPAVERDTSGIHYLRESGGPGIPRTLDALKSAVRGGVQGVSR